MPDAAAALETAIRLHQAGSLDAAGALYRDILAIDPDHHEGIHLLGLIAHQRGDFGQAVTTIGRAVALDPSAAHYRSNLGSALRSAGRLDEAADALEAARALRPGSAHIASNLGSILTELGQVTKAVCLLREAVALDPALPDAHYNLANALCRAGEKAQAVAAYVDCLRLRAGFADAHFNMGHTLASLGRTDEAALCYRQALRIDPTHADACLNLGASLQAADRVEEAESWFAEAARLRPADPAIRCNQGAALLAQGRGPEAGTCFAAVRAAWPDHGGARLGEMIAHLPTIARDEAELESGRSAYADALARFEPLPEGPLLKSLAVAAGDYRPHLLAYQGEDDRVLQASYGRLMHRLAQPPASVLPVRTAGERLRIGIVSGFFRDHTIWTLFLRGWLEKLDPARFRLFAYHTGMRRDARTDRAATLCERLCEGTRPPQAWRDEVLADAPHVLLYPEIGLDPVSAKLAAQRLAAVQCVAWGHPVTTGMPSIDYFLSGSLMEPADAAAHYTERLVTLPNLGVFCEPAANAPSPRERAEFGFRQGATLYWSGQNLPKYLPRYDEVFPRIARMVPDSQFVFIAFGHGEAMTRIFADRLRHAFARFGLDSQAHCVILPQLPQEAFLAAASLCDVVLDTIGWSGGKSTLDLLAVSPAIVTLPGRFMRGRHSAAILDMMGVRQTIARTLDDYVDIAVRLGRTPELRKAIRDDVARRSHLVFRDDTAIDALGTFLENAADRARARLVGSGRTCLVTPPG